MELEQRRLLGDDDILRAAFNKYDADGNGYIDARELSSILRDQGYNEPDHVVKMILNKSDVDMSGQLDFGEFVKMMYRFETSVYFEKLRSQVRTNNTYRDQAFWRAIFERYDQNGNGTISRRELKRLLMDNAEHIQISENTLRNIFDHADDNGDGELDFNEFFTMVHSKEFSRFTQAIREKADAYVRLIVPQVRRTTDTEFDGQYDSAYSCCPPPVVLLTASLIEIILYLYDWCNGYDNVSKLGTVAEALLYEPTKRYEAWRYLTYMFVHIGSYHLIVNVLIQLTVGIPLELVHKWRVLVVYLAGVIAGSLGTSVTDPRVRLAGASGGVYSLLTAHLATVAMNWSEMSYPIIHMSVFLIIIVSDVGTAIYNRYVLSIEESIGYAAHFFGALAGLLLGVVVLKNLKITKHEKYMQAACLAIYIVSMLIAIGINIWAPNYFPKQV